MLIFFLSRQLVGLFFYVFSSLIILNRICREIAKIFEEFHASISVPYQKRGNICCCNGVAIGCVFYPAYLRE